LGRYKFDQGEGESGVGEEGESRDKEALIGSTE